ncbi:MAG: diaminopimelate epimerase [Planctomycetales bacterium]|nr:diaminopimelate epimerase [Planctomycetales bacterium]
MVLICPAENAHAEMRMYNVDGSYSENCGNALRCVAKYVYEHGIAQESTLKIATGGRVLQTRLTVNGGVVEKVQIDMGEPVLSAAEIPTTLPGDPPVDALLTAGDREFRVTSVSMGNPHCVVYVDELTDELVSVYGPLIETHASFPRRVNVEFVQVLDRGRVRQRTWERGSGETLACGTGACAVCVAGTLTNRTDRKLAVELLGGTLEIEWRSSDNRVQMTGPAVEVYHGEFALPLA